MHVRWLEAEVGSMCPIVIISLRNLLRSDLDGNDISLSQVDCLDTETQNKTIKRCDAFEILINLSNSLQLPIETK